MIACRWLLLRLPVAIEWRLVILCKMLPLWYTIRYTYHIIPLAKRLRTFSWFKLLAGGGVGCSIGNYPPETGRGKTNIRGRVPRENGMIYYAYLWARKEDFLCRRGGRIATTKVAPTVGRAADVVKSNHEVIRNFSATRSVAVESETERQMLQQLSPEC